MTVAAARRANAMWTEMSRGMPAVGRHRTPVPGSGRRPRSCGPLAKASAFQAALPRSWGLLHAHQPPPLRRPQQPAAGPSADCEASDSSRPAAGEGAASGARACRADALWPSVHRACLSRSATSLSPSPLPRP